MLEIYDHEQLELIGKKSWELSMENKTPKDYGIQPLVTTPQHFELGQVLIIEGVAYSIIIQSGKSNEPLRSIAYVRKLLNQIPFTTDKSNADPGVMFDERDLKCPYCGTIHDNVHEMKDHEDNYRCCVCNSEFAYQRNVVVSFDIVPVKRSEPKTFSYQKKDGPTMKLVGRSETLVKRGEYCCELTEGLTELLYAITSDLYRVYIVDRCQKSDDLALRVPGCTIGYIKTDENNTIINAVIANYALKRFKTDPNEYLKEFIGQVIEYP